MRHSAQKINGRSTDLNHLIPLLVDVTRCFPKHEILARFTVDEILALIPEEDGNYGRKIAIQTDFGPIYVSIASKKLLTFKQSLTCATCHAVGSYFLLVRNPHAKGRASLELFTDEGKLLTRDHIMPKSLGGGNEMSNSQTMCLMCNSQKGSKLPLVTAAAGTSVTEATSSSAKAITAGTIAESAAAEAVATIAHSH